MKKFLLFMMCVLGILAFIFSEIALGKTVLLRDNTVILRGPVTDVSVSQLMLDIMKKRERYITVYISSPGGSVIAGNRLIDFMKGSGKSYTCVVDYAASMAFNILQACGRRYTTNSSVLMQHVSSWGVRGQDPNNRALIKLLTQILDYSDNLSSKRMGITAAEYRKRIRDDYWLYGKQAVLENASDATVSVLCSKKLIKGRTTQKITSLFSTHSVVWSACPLINIPLKIDDDEILKSYNRDAWNTDYIKQINTFGATNE